MSNLFPTPANVPNLFGESSVSEPITAEEEAQALRVALFRAVAQRDANANAVRRHRFRACCDECGCAYPHHASDCDRRAGYYALDEQKRIESTNNIIACDPPLTGTIHKAQIPYALRISRHWPGIYFLPFAFRNKKEAR